MDSIQEHSSGPSLTHRRWRGDRRRVKLGQTTGDVDTTIDTAHDEPAAPTPERPRGANWVAAYAMGLASARSDIESCRRELVEAADGAPERLEQARERLRELDGFDDGLRARAEQLLTASLEQTAVGR